MSNEIPNFDHTELYPSGVPPLEDRLHYVEAACDLEFRAERLRGKTRAIELDPSFQQEKPPLIMLVGSYAMTDSNGWLHALHAFHEFRANRLNARARDYWRQV